MDAMSSGLEKSLNFCIYTSLMVLALGLLTSTTLLSLSHIFMAFPAFLFLFKGNYKNYSKSMWALVFLTIIIILSVLLNQEVATKGLKPALKAKYFLFGFASVAPLYWYFTNFYDVKKIKYLINAFCIATTSATIIGLIVFFTGANLLNVSEVQQLRNSGTFGMIMNYAHNMSYFLIIILGLYVYREKTQDFIKPKYLLIVLLINIVGIYFSYTRGAWLAFLAGIPFFYFVYNKKLFLKICLGLCVLGVAVYFIAGKNIIRPDSEADRILQWKAAIIATQERPILGYGYLNFETHSIDIKRRHNLGSLKFGSHAHNNFLEMLASTGVIGFIAFVVWLALWFIEMYKRNDVISKISIPFIIVFIVGGLTQSTISLGINLFFVMAAYSIGQINVKNHS